jgi:hypothetical protein
MKKRKFDEGGSIDTTPNEPTGRGSLGFYPMPMPTMDPAFTGDNTARGGLNQINQGASTVSGALDVAQNALGGAGGGGGGGSDFAGGYLMDKLKGLGFGGGSSGVTMKKGGKVKGYAKGGSIKSASSRGDGIAQRGKTRGKMY